MKSALRGTTRPFGRFSIASLYSSDSLLHVVFQNLKSLSFQTQEFMRCNQKVTVSFRKLNFHTTDLSIYASSICHMHTIFTTRKIIFASALIKQINNFIWNQTITFLHRNNRLLQHQRLFQGLQLLLSVELQYNHWVFVTGRSTCYELLKNLCESKGRKNTSPLTRTSNSGFDFWILKFENDYFWETNKNARRCQHRTKKRLLSIKSYRSCVVRTTIILHVLRTPPFVIDTIA